MTDHTDHTDAGAPAVRTAFGRREMLQRGGFVVGAAALWATPVVQTIGMRAAAATDGPELCEGGPAGGSSQKPDSLTFALRDVSDAQKASYSHACTAEQIANNAPGNSNNWEPQTDPVKDDSSCDPGSGDARVTFGGSTYDLTFGQQFTVAAGADDVPYSICYGDESYGTTIHTSCSRRLCIGDFYGPLELVDWS